MPWLPSPSALPARSGLAENWISAGWCLEAAAVKPSTLAHAAALPWGMRRVCPGTRAPPPPPSPEPQEGRLCWVSVSLGDLGKAA